MIKKFNGDLEELRELILNSWHRKLRGKFFYDYTVPFLDWCLNAPEKDPELQISYYKKEKLAGFLASLPRTMVMDGVKGKYNITTFYSVDQNVKGFTAYKLAKEFNRRYPLLGYEAVIYYIDRQSAGSEKIIKANFERDNINYDVTGESYFLLKILDYKRVNDFFPLPYFLKKNLEILESRIYKPSCRGKTRFYKPSEDLPLCPVLLNSYTEKLRFARLWSQEELAWQLHYPGIANTLVYETGGSIKGLINYYISDVIKENKRDSLAKIDNIYFGDMTYKERKKFLIESIELIKASHDPAGITLFYTPYFYSDSWEKYSSSSFISGEDFEDELFESVNFHPEDDSIKIYFIIFNEKSYKGVFPFYLDYK